MTAIVSPPARTLSRHSTCQVEPRTAFGAGLRSRRVAKGWSQLDLAAAAGVPPRTVNWLEIRNRGGSFAYVYRLARALAWPLDDVLRRIEQG